MRACSPQLDQKSCSPLVPLGTFCLGHRPCRPRSRAAREDSTISGQAILEAYDFSGIGSLADVGGGHGTLLAAILRQCPQMHGMLYDLPEVVAAVPASQFAGCEGRIR